jgi:hypothetical protein
VHHQFASKTDEETLDILAQEWRDNIPEADMHLGHLGTLVHEHSPERVLNAIRSTAKVFRQIAQPHDPRGIMALFHRHLNNGAKPPAKAAHTPDHDCTKHKLHRDECVLSLNEMQRWLRVEFDERVNNTFCITSQEANELLLKHRAEFLLQAFTKLGKAIAGKALPEERIMALLPKAIAIVEAEEKRFAAIHGSAAA